MNGAGCAFTPGVGVKCTCTTGWFGQACNLNKSNLKYVGFNN